MFSNFWVVVFWQYVMLISNGFDAAVQIVLFHLFFQESTISLALKHMNEIDLTSSKLTKGSQLCLLFTPMQITRMDMMYL